MAKMIDIEKLKPLLNGVLTEENETSFLEGVIAESVDYDDKAVQSRIDSEVEKARAEAKADYSKKLHDMFFGTGESNDSKDTPDDTKTDPELNNDDNVEIPDIF